jgi:Uma2 family endonuclease
MFQLLPNNRITFKEFVKWIPEVGRYELHDGVIVEMPQPLGGHEEVIGFLSIQLGVQIYQLGLPYLIPKVALVKPSDSESGYSPDILLVNRENLINEELWQKESTVTQGASIPLVVEVVSTNWRDDYYIKYGVYEGIGIPEYWIVDYLGLGGKKFTGNPKQPTILIFSLLEEEYQVRQFRGNERIQSPTFPALNLTAQEIFQAGSV